MDRREFLKGTAWMGFLAAAGCATRHGITTGGSMATYADKPFRKLRVGIVGLGRGYAAFRSFPVIPGCEVSAVCDINPARVKAALATIEKRGQKAKPKVYTGSPEAWKGLCDDPDVDLVWNSTPWELHVPIALYAMKAGKHVAVEVPAAFTVDECWELVETSEKTQRHCMQLENACYGEAVLLALNLVRQGKLGEVVHCEGAYIHDLRAWNYGEWDWEKGNGKAGAPAYWDYWRLRHNAKHKGDQYPTHGLGPVCQYLDINRGDRFDYMVSLESDQKNFETYAKAAFPRGSWQAKKRVDMGDMNTMLIKTALGRSIMIQHDISSPRPYSLINRVTGTSGSFEGIFFPGKEPAGATAIKSGCYCRFGWEDAPGKGVHQYFDERKAAEVREQYKHPLWKQAGDIAVKVGGHGGVDFMMCLRVAYCLQKGLPLDQNVYDLASWCCLCELSEKSVRSGSTPQTIPDFTCGGWRTAPRLEMDAVDVSGIAV